jgi:two-component system, OmpR family, sensor histidine kinase CiaH
MSGSRKRGVILARTMFHAARLRLTAWYLVILAMVVAGLSIALYRILLLTQEAELRVARPASNHPLVHAFAHDEVILAYQIVAVDAAVLLVAAAGAFLLAGRTLRPIEDSMERQRRFAAAASHELRTPLTALQGNLEVGLLNPRSTDEYQQLLRDAVSDAERMGQLVKDLTLLARPEVDRTVLRHEPIDLVDAACAAVKDVELLALRKEQTVESEFNGSLPTVGDAPRLRQVFVNLLENGIRYTPEGGAICIAGRQEHGRAVVEVRDTGVGIAPGELAHLFEPFYRADKARSNADHVGLGLSLASWIVHAHSGKISVASQPGVGSVFTVSLPLSSAHPAKSE